MDKGLVSPHNFEIRSLHFGSSAPNRSATLSPTDIDCESVVSGVGLNYRPIWQSEFDLVKNVVTACTVIVTNKFSNCL